MPLILLERISYFVFGWLIARDKGLLELVNAGPDCRIDQGCLMVCLSILVARPLHWFSNLVENMGLIVSGQVCLCFELLRLEANNSVVLWVLVHLETGLDCPADQLMRKGWLFSR